jgi:hypothetical protein
MNFVPCNHFLKIWESIETLIPKMRVHLGVWRFIPFHSLTLPGAWNMTPGLTFGPPLCKPCLGREPKARVATYIFLHVTKNIMVKWWIKEIQVNSNIHEVNRKKIQGMHISWETNSLLSGNSNICQITFKYVNSWYAFFLIFEWSFVVFWMASMDFCE